MELGFPVLLFQTPKRSDARQGNDQTKRFLLVFFFDGKSDISLKALLDLISAPGESGNVFPASKDFSLHRTPRYVLKARSTQYYPEVFLAGTSSLWPPCVDLCAMEF
jgi:hypothetical protein